MQLSTLVSRLDDRLRTADFADIDASPNGLQIGPETADVERAAVAVDAAADTIERAAAANADLLVTHHGLVWDGLERVTGRAYDRIAQLVEADLALYVSHLPLDAHPDLGNAAGLADRLDLEYREPFGAIGGEHIGQRGRLPVALPADELAATLDDALDTGGRDVHVLEFGPEEIEDVAIVTGSGADWLDEAATAGADAFVTGEGKHQLYHEAKEAGVTVLLAGHYATETFGVRALGSLLAEWGLETTSIDAPTGL